MKRSRYFVLVVMLGFLAGSAWGQGSGESSRYKWLKPKQGQGEQAATGKYLGRLSANPYQADSVSNPYGTYGSRYSANSINNPYGQYGSPYSAKSASNPYTTGGPSVVAEDGTYLGRLNSNQYDPESVSNPYGVYGSPYSPKSIKNPYSKYGSQYSPYSATNPYATQAPRLYDPAFGTRKPPQKNSWGLLDWLNKDD